MPVITCAKCGVSRDRHKGAKYCSKECWATRAARAACETCGVTFKPKGKTSGRFCSKNCWLDSRNVQVQCRQCGKVERLKRFQARGRKYCSRECRDESMRIRTTKHCEQCGDAMSVATWDEARRFCSKPCMLEGTKHLVRVDVDAIAMRYQRGSGVAELAWSFDVSACVILRRLREAGVTIRPRRGARTADYA